MTLSKGAARAAALLDAAEQVLTTQAMPTRQCAISQPRPECG